MLPEDLQQLPFFHGKPIVSAAVLSSLSHQNWHIITQEHGSFFVRVYQADLLNLSHRIELKCQLKAARLGLAPTPLWYQQQPGVLISEYLADAQHFQYQPARAQELAQLLARFHQGKLKVPMLDGVAYLQQLKAAIKAEHRLDLALFNQVMAVVKQHASLAQDSVLCHRDLTPENILLANDRLYLIDFEYVCLADASFDLATISFHHQLSTTEEQHWLRCYAKARAITEAEQALLWYKVRLAKAIYCGWCWLWYLTQPHYGELAQMWQQKLQTILSR